MISIEADPEGKVVAVCADLKHHFSKSPRSSITLIAGCGIKGDIRALKSKRCGEIRAYSTTNEGYTQLWATSALRNLRSNTPRQTVNSAA
jgi:hypothetical protein